MVDAALRSKPLGSKAAPNQLLLTAASANQDCLFRAGLWPIDAELSVRAPRLTNTESRNMTGSLRILHIMRTPVGGLFRHVVDLARGQAARGHRVGLVVDASTGGAAAEAVLAALAPHLELGMTRVAMGRHLDARDIAACAHVAARAAATEADVLHGHGAKGGAYARLARAKNAIRVYTPHGGSLHYRWSSPAGFVYLASERLLMARTDLFLFESAYGHRLFQSQIGEPGSHARVIHNDLTEAEFAPVAARPEATDLVFVGELRRLKGVDVLVEALARLAQSGKPATATIVGDGPDRMAFEAAAAARGLNGAVRFVGAKDTRAGFALGRVLVVPSRAESLPYIVLEAAAAGVPLIATRAGGIAEILGADAARLVPPGDANALAAAISAALADPIALRQCAMRLRLRVREAFSADVMTAAVLAAYAETLAIG
jgi:glycosyltransferase involved in cell wall biosynthesis